MVLTGRLHSSFIQARSMSDPHSLPEYASPKPTPPTVHLRAPSHTLNPPSTTPDSKHVPPTSYLEGTWHITHSSLPMWRKAQNVTVTYEVLREDGEHRPTFGNVVEYQNLGEERTKWEGGRIKSVRGSEAPMGDGYGRWRWRGKGWLMIASSDWEILGFGRSRSSDKSVYGNATPPSPHPHRTRSYGQTEGEMERMDDDWVVTYFQSTLFTPAGIDIYCRRREGLDKSVLERIRKVLREECGSEVARLAGDMVEIKVTGV